MSLAILVWKKEKGLWVSKFELSAPAYVKDYLETKLKENKSNDWFLRGLSSIDVVKKSYSGGNGPDRVSLHLLLSWMEEGFGMLESVTATTGEYHYVFRESGEVDISTVVARPILS